MLECVMVCVLECVMVWDVRMRDGVLEYVIVCDVRMCNCVWR